MQGYTTRKCTICVVSDYILVDVVSDYILVDVVCVVIDMKLLIQKNWKSNKKLKFNHLKNASPHSQRLWGHDYDDADTDGKIGVSLMSKKQLVDYQQLKYL